MQFLFFNDGISFREGEHVGGDDDEEREVKEREIEDVKNAADDEDSFHFVPDPDIPLPEAVYDPQPPDAIGNVNS